MQSVTEIVDSLSNASSSGGGGSICFIGAGGIGMSALARYFNSKGCRVTGYDKTATALCKQLEAEGIQLHYEDSLEFIDKHAALVVYTPAIPKDHQELNYYQQHGFVVAKRSDVLGAITNSSFNICVAGTHGKTTTSTMVAHILRHSGFGCNAFLGGIAANYNTNFWPQAPVEPQASVEPQKNDSSSNKNVCVVEADEYDRSFLKLSPDVAIITSMDADHLDIYGTAENVEQAFIDFSARVKAGGLLISKHGLARGTALTASNHLTYHVSDKNASLYAANITMSNGTYKFDVCTNNESWQLNDVVLKMGGMHNVENITAAIAVAHNVGISDEKIKAAVEDFKGVKRRFQYIIAPVASSKHAAVMIDDYAHHPEELRGLITGAKKLFPDKKCTLIFQPHLYSRTRDFAEGFAEVLDMADEIILLPIYPARELPIEGVTSEMIAELMHSETKMVLSKENMLKHLQQETTAHVEEGYEGNLVITAGAGDIDTLVEPVKNILEGTATAVI